MPLLTAILLISSPLIFGKDLVPSEVEVGKQLAKKGKRLDRGLERNGVQLGTWFDGERRRTVEEAVLLTPGFMSRWLGYRQQKGEIDAKGVAKVWDDVRQLGSEGVPVVIRLARLCNIAPDDGNLDNNAFPEHLDKLRIQFRTIRKGIKSSDLNPKLSEEASEWQSIELTTFQDLQDRRPEYILKSTWEQAFNTKMQWPLPGTGAPLVSEIRWGKNRLVTAVGVIPKWSEATHGEFQIIEPDRKRTVRFTLPTS